MNRVPLFVLIALAALMTGCATLPPLEGRTSTTALTDTAGTRLGRGLAADVAAHPGKTGIHPLPNPRDAFAARVVLAASAEKSIDAQYYIWHGDQVGYLFFEALFRAADRGVRVRLLLDDLNTGGLDPTVAALDAHSNIEVRLYNPLTQRGARMLNFLTDFERVNRRMHNKSFTVDNQVSIVGGRNIGNEYFAAGEGVVFADLDVIAVGPAVRDVSKQFDAYWNSPSAYPATSFVFDQRSARLNTEMGFVIDSPKLALKVDEIFDTTVALAAFEVRLAPDGSLEWIERTASAEKRYDTEPGTSWLRRMNVEFLSILPIEWLL